MSDEKVFVPYAEAVKRLPDGDKVHTFRQAGPCMVGADWTREQVLAALEKAGDKIEETGPQAMAMKHGLAIIDKTGVLFIEASGPAEVTP